MISQKIMNLTHDPDFSTQKCGTPPSFQDTKLSFLTRRTVLVCSAVVNSWKGSLLTRVPSGHNFSFKILSFKHNQFWRCTVTSSANVSITRTEMSWWRDWQDVVGIENYIICLDYSVASGGTRFLVNNVPRPDPLKCFNWTSES